MVNINFTICIYVYSLIYSILFADMSIEVIGRLEDEEEEEEEETLFEQVTVYVMH